MRIKSADLKNVFVREMKGFKQNEDVSSNLDVYIYLDSLTSEVHVVVKEDLQLALCIHSTLQ